MNKLHLIMDCETIQELIKGNHWDEALDITMTLLKKIRDGKRAYDMEEQMRQESGRSETATKAA